MPCQACRNCGKAWDLLLVVVFLGTTQGGLKVLLPRTQMTLVLIGKGLVLGGLTFKNRGHLGSRCLMVQKFGL